MVAKDGRVATPWTRAFGPRLRRLTALTALATRPLIATKRSTARCGQSVCKCHAEKFRSAIFARIRPPFTRTVAQVEGWILGVPGLIGERDLDCKGIKSHARP